jgi:hypothetical protein
MHAKAAPLHAADRFGLASEATLHDCYRVSLLFLQWSTGPREKVGTHSNYCKICNH